MEMHALHNWSDGDTFYVNHIVSTSLSMCDIFNVFTVCFRSHLFIRHKLIIRMVFVCLFDHSFASAEIRLLRLKFAWNTIITTMNWCELQNDPIRLLWMKQWHFILDAQKPMILTKETNRKENKKNAEKNANHGNELAC